MNKFSFSMILGAILFSMTGVTFSSTIVGRIKQIVYGTGQSPARVSILIDSSTVASGTYASPCPTPYYFAYENADSGIAKVWTSASLAAYAASKQVTIVGSGSCDPYSLEGVTTFVVQ